jgi:hypothetical protein
MADALVDRIMDSARSRLPGAIDTQVYFELASVLDEFFNLSTCWREKIYVPVVSPYTEYELDSANMASRIISLIGFVNSNDTPYGATLNSNNVMTLTRALETGDYYAWVALTVAKKLNDGNYPVFPQWVADRYGDVLADGIVGRMMAMPAKPYSSPNHALYYSKRFRNGAQLARVEINRQNLVGGQNWQFPRFAAQGN